MNLVRSRLGSTLLLSVLLSFVVPVPASSAAGAPLAPAAPVAQAQNKSALLSWVAPFDNGSAITSYTVTSTPEGKFCTTSGLSCTISGLANGTTYQFSVIATNSGGSSPASPLSAGISPSFVSKLEGISLGLPNQNLVAVELNNDGSLAYAITSTQLIKFDLGGNSQLGLMNAAGSETFTDVALSPDGETLFVVSSAWNIYRISTASFSVSSVINTSGAREVVVNQSNTIFYVLTSGSLLKYSMADNSLILTRTGWTGTASHLAMGPDGASVFFHSRYAGSSTDGYRIRATEPDLRLSTTKSTATVSLYLRVWAGTQVSPLGFQVAATNRSSSTSTPSVSLHKYRTLDATQSAADYLSFSSERFLGMTLDSSGRFLTVITNTSVRKIDGVTFSVLSTTNLSQAGFSSLTPNRVALNSTSPYGLIFSNDSLSQTLRLNALDVPGPVRSQVGQFGDSSATISWLAPVDQGSSAITKYLVTASPGGQTCETSTLSCTVGQLSNGTSYTFTIRAQNSDGFGLAAHTAEVIPATVPGVPSFSAVTAQPASASLSWLAPSSNGGSAIISYLAIASPGGASCTTGATSCTITGLTNGTSYTFRVSANNKAGSSGFSIASSAIVPIAPASSPQSISAVYGNSSAVITWQAPSNIGGSDITRYKVSTSPTGGSCEVTAPTTSCAIQGLTNGTSYVARVVAVNGAGDGTVGQSAAFVPKTVPAQVSGVSASPGNTSATVTWNTPANGGASIIRYIVTSEPGGKTCTTTATSCSVIGLTNSTPYTFSVVAENSEGTGPAGVSNEVTPASLPTAPQNLIADPDNGRVVLTWEQPASDGGQPITGYQVYGRPTSSFSSTLYCQNTAQLTCTISGLTNGTSYYFFVRATTIIGTGPSTPLVTSTPRTVPARPSAPTPTRGDSSVTLNWSAPNNGGSVITSYTATSSPGNFSCTVSATSCTISGLTNGTSYTFSLYATNIAGNSPISLASSAVIPATVPSNPRNVGLLAQNGAVSISWTAPESTGGASISQYRVTASPGGRTCTTNASTFACTISSLTNGIEYSFVVQALNSVGYSLGSSALTETPHTVPSAPRSFVGTESNSSILLAWLEPSSNGGSQVTNYVVTLGGNSVCETSSTTCEISNLTNGNSYTFAIRAQNRAGFSTAISSSILTPRTTPDAPTNITVDAQSNRISVSWTNSADGGAPIESTMVDLIDTSNQNLVSRCQTAFTSCNFAFLPLGITYRIDLSSRNEAGSSPVASSQNITLVAPPSAPLGLTAVAGNEEVELSWLAPASNGGAEITEYIIYLDGVALAQTVTDTTATIINLVNGQEYEIQVVAKNSAGTGAYSSSAIARPWPKPDTIGSAQIAGQIRDIESGLAIPNLRVEAILRFFYEGQTYDVIFSTQTNNQGRYQFVDLPQNQDVILTVGGAGTSFARAELRFPTGGTNSLKTKDFFAKSLGLAAGAIEGIIVGPDYEPLINTRIELIYDRDSSFNQSSETNLSGEFSFDFLPPGDYRIQVFSYQMQNGRYVYKNGYQEEFLYSISSMESVFTDQVLQVSTYEVGDSSIQGQVFVENSNIPVPNWGAVLIPLSADVPAQDALTDSNGRYTFSGLPAGNYRILFNSGESGSVRSRIPSAIDVSVGPSETSTAGNVYVRFLADGAGSATVVVRDEITNLPLSGVRVEVHLQDATNTFFIGTTDSNGRASFVGLNSGGYNVSLVKDGYTAITLGQEFELTSGLVQTTFRLRQQIKTGTVTGIVVDQSGNPIEDARVYASWGWHDGCCQGDGGGPLVQTGPDGSYTLENILVGSEIELFAEPIEPGLVLQKKRITIPIDLEGAFVQDFEVGFGGNLSGFVSTDSSAGAANFTVYVIDPATNETVDSDLISQSGAFDFENLPVGDYLIAVADTRNQGQGQTNTSQGYVANIGALRSTLVPDQNLATEFTVSANSTTRVGVIEATTAATLTGSLGISAGESRLSAFERVIYVELLLESGQHWESTLPYRMIYVDGSSGGDFAINGILPGNYKLRFFDIIPGSRKFDDLYFGSTDSINEASVISVTGNGTIDLGNLTMVKSRPSQSPTQISLTQLDDDIVASLQGLVSANETTNNVEIVVGEEFVGEWVTVSFTPAVSVQSWIPEDFADARLVNLSLQANNLTSWYQVNSVGKVIVPKSNVTGTTLTVQDANNNLIGWTTVTVAPIVTPPSSGGGGGGGGGGAPAASKPLQLTRSFFTGTVSSGQTVTGDVGTWEKSENLLFRYQWHRCNKELINPDAPTVQLNCSPIFGAEQINYLVTDSEKDKFLLLEVIARDKTGTLIAAANVFSDTVGFGKTATKPTTVTPTTPTAKPYGITRLAGNKARFQAFDPVGKGRISYRLNGREVAWINARNSRDKKIRAVNGTPAFSKTVTLRKGKNTLEIWVKGKRQSRVSITLP